MMNVIKGDLIELAKEGKFDGIVHGCNCFNNMGSGIAKQIKDNFPDAWQVDQDTEPGAKTKLGDFSVVLVPPSLTIINAYTQYRYGRGKKHADYDAIRKVFKSINYYYPDWHIGIPKIGAGLAGGDWDIISKIIDEETPDVEITLVEYDKGVTK